MSTTTTQSNNPSTSDASGAHTPGPWLRDAEQPSAIVVDQGDGFTRLIAECMSSDEDARLIAAAPALLAALKDCAQSLQILADKEGAYRVTCLSQARTAIAAATGTAA